MSSYNPDNGPDPGEWLALDEHERVEQVRRYHEKHRIQLPSVEAHALFHVIIENQLAEGSDVVPETLARMRREGLSRHDAIHAIASVLVAHMHALLGEASSRPVNDDYFAALKDLTAEKWRNSGLTDS